MDRRPFSFRQLVRHTDLNGVQDDLESALHDQTRHMLGVGILTGGAVFPHDPPSDQGVLLSPTLAWDTQGRRIHIRNRFTDRVAALIPLDTLREQAIDGIPEGDGTLVLFSRGEKTFLDAFAPQGKPVILTGATGPLFTTPTAPRDISVPPEGLEAKPLAAPQTYSVREVTTTTLSGLVPQQTALILTENLPVQGWAPGLAPTGTPLTLDLTSDDPVPIDLSSALETLPPDEDVTLEVWARFARYAFDERLDGHGNPVAHRALEHFELGLRFKNDELLIMNDENQNATDKESHNPSVITHNSLSPSDTFLARIHVHPGQPITQADIDTSGQTRLHSLQEVQPTHTEELLHLTVAGGGALHWDGDTLHMPLGLTVGLPTSAFGHTLPPFTQAIADHHALWILLPRQAGRAHTLTATVFPAGTVPAHAANQIPWQLAMRRGETLHGLFLGTLNPGHSRSLGQGVSQETLDTIHTKLQALTAELDQAQETLRQQQDHLHMLNQEDQNAQTDRADLRTALQQAQARNQEQDNNLHGVRDHLLGLALLPLWQWSRDSAQDTWFGYLRHLWASPAKNPANIEAIAYGEGMAYRRTGRDTLWQRPSSQPNGTLHALAYNPQQARWLVVGDGAALAHSTDARVWTSVTPSSLPSSPAFYGCDSNHDAQNPLWVVVGEQGTVLTARAATGPFRKADSLTQNDLQAVAHNHRPGDQGRWVILGDNDTVLTSADGSSWALRHINGIALPQAEFPKLAWDETMGRFIVFHHHGNGQVQVFASPDGDDWTLLDTHLPTPLLITAVAGVGDLWVLNAEGELLVSPDLTAASWHTSPGSMPGYGSLVYSGLSRCCYQVGDDGDANQFWRCNTLPTEIMNY